MSPVYNFSCSCGHTEERIVHHSVENVECSKCNGVSVRQFSPPNRHDGSQEAPAWLRSVLDVVDRDNPAKHVQDFVKNPTRANYKAWMKGEGIRPMDSNVNGAPPIYRKPERDTSDIRREVMDKHIARRRIEVR